MDWIDEAIKHTTEPAVIVEIDFDSGTRKYSVDYIRPIGDPAYKGNILNLPVISNSIGDIVRTFIYSKIEIIFADTDREFRTLIVAEGIKNREVRIKIIFINETVSITSLTTFKGNIFSWSPMRELKFKIECEQKSKNLENTYPDKGIEKGDYPYADESTLGLLIPVPYGMISALGLSNDGAFSAPFVDVREDLEKNLVGLQIYSELVANGEFDPTTNAWFPLNSATLASAANGRIGKCLSITENGASSPGAYQNITVRPGSTYQVHGYVKAGTEDVYSIWIWDRINLAWIHEGAWIAETAGDWSTEVEAVFTAPAGCTQVMIGLYSQSLNAEAKTIYFDGITTTEVIGISRVYKDKVLQTEGSTEDYIIKYNLIGEGSGFILNGSFVDISDWTAGNSAAIASVAGGEVGNCLRVTENGHDSPYAYQDVTVIPGSRYHITGHVKKGTEDWWMVNIKNASTGETIGWTWGVELAGDWSSTFSLYFNVPSGCTEMRVCLGSWSESGEGKDLYFDSIACSVEASFVHATIDWVAGNRPTIDNIISCDLMFGDRGPIEAWRHFLKGFCEYSDADFHAASYNTARLIEDERNYKLDGAFIEERVLLAHEDQIRNEFELDIWRDPKDGLVHFKYMSSLIEADVHYRDYLDILVGYEPDTQVTKIINYLKFMYNYNYARTYFHNLPYREDLNSQTKYGAIYRSTHGFYFVRSLAVATDLAIRKLLRRKDPIILDDFPLPLKAFNDNLSNIIEITHFEGKGSEGYQKKSFQLRSTEDSLDELTRREILEDVSNYVGLNFILGPADLPLYTLATAEQQEKYGFLCDPDTEEYSNGDPAKRLYD